MRSCTRHSAVNPLILHIETSSVACSVALSRGKELIAAQTRAERYIHSSALGPMSKELMESQGVHPTDLRAVSVSIGPGSYTGLRVGLSFAKGLCTVLGCPLIAVDTLQSLARTARLLDAQAAHLYIAAVDARRQDAFVGYFDADGMKLAENEFLTVGDDTLQSWRSADGQIVICGEGLEKWSQFDGLTDIRIVPIRCDARNLVSFATQMFENQQFADLQGCVPTYIKAPNITIPAQ